MQRCRYKYCLPKPYFARNKTEKTNRENNGENSAFFTTTYYLQINYQRQGVGHRAGCIYSYRRLRKLSTNSFGLRLKELIRLAADGTNA
jgi:hypothetical protein